jgi:DNA repair exonuclease SbcCD nuclease subunit
MRLLHFADLHLDTPFRWASPELARSRRLALRATFVRICELAIKERVDALTCGGDLFEQERFTPATAQLLRSTFAELAPVPVFIAPGNHDWMGPASLYRQVRWSPNVHVFETAELRPATLTFGLTLWGAAHCAPANTANFLEGFGVDRSGTHLALFHGSAQGGASFHEEGKVPYAPFRPEQIERAGFQHAFLGHFHRPIDTASLTYPGNPDPLTFGEAGERGAVLATVDNSGGVSTRRFVVSSSQVHDVTVDLSGITHAEQASQRVLEAVNGLHGVARVTLQGDVGPDVDLRLQDIATLPTHDLDALVPRLGPISVAYDFDALSQEPTVRGRFVRDVLAATDLTDEQRQRVLVTGLRALDGRSDELEVH